MTAPPAIAGVYADLRQVKTRGVWQLVIDVPADKVEGMVKLFGMPRQDEPAWLAVTRLNSSPGSAAPEVQRLASGRGDAAPTLTEDHRVESGGPKRERTLPEKVWWRCEDKRFQEWLYSKGRVTGSAGDAAQWVRQECGVTSRSEILPGTEAAARWVKLETQYLLETGQMAEAR